LLQVWDTGIGIAESDQARLSEEFFQGSNAHEDPSQSRGFGLGLAIAHPPARSPRRRRCPPRRCRCRRRPPGCWRRRCRSSCWPARCPCR
jgi:hypothetical protein